MAAGAKRTGRPACPQHLSLMPLGSVRESNRPGWGWISLNRDVPNAVVKGPCRRQSNRSRRACAASGAQQWRDWRSTWLSRGLRRCMKLHRMTGHACSCVLFLYEETQPETRKDCRMWSALQAPSQQQCKCKPAFWGLRTNCEQSRRTDPTETPTRMPKAPACGRRATWEEERTGTTMAQNSKFEFGNGLVGIASGDAKNPWLMSTRTCKGRGAGYMGGARRERLRARELDTPAKRSVGGYPT